MLTIVMAKKEADNSHAAVLIHYASDTQSKENRIRDTWAINLSEDPECAALEIEAVQRNNKQSRTDKLYHMIVSFHAEDADKLTPQALREIDREIAKAIGFENHQRFLAYHTDTKNPHLHFIANRINPQTFKAASPYFDFNKLAKVCERFENKLNLIKDPHEIKRTKAERLARNIEARAGVESFSSYVIREVGADLTAAKSWNDFHAALSKISIAIRPRGNGLVIVDTEEREYKASSITPEFSKSKLEKRFGKYTPANETPTPKPKSWRKKRLPTGFTVDVSPLLERYMAGRDDRDSAMPGLRSIAFNKKLALKVVEFRRRKFLNECAAKHIKRKDALLYAGIFKEAEKEIKKESNEQRKQFCKTHRGYGFLDWLQQQALAGDIEALTALRSRDTNHCIPDHSNNQGVLINGITIAVLFSKELKVDFITKQGIVVYRAGEGTVSDNGASIRVSNKVDEQGLIAALHLARKQFGKSLNIEGSDFFKERVVNAAALSGIDIQFTDKTMERKRAKRQTMQANASIIQG